MSSTSCGGAVTRLTPAGSAGVAVLRIEGGAVERLSATFSGELPGPGRIAYGVLAGTDEDPGILDEVLLVRARAGPGGTKDCAPAFELHVHGSPFLVAEITRRLAPPVPGGSLSTHGETASFGERARSRVHTAPSVLGARILLDQADGAMDRALAAVRELPVPERATAIAELARRGRQRERLFRESTVALVGEVNAGKSTLFNVLVGAEAASVSSEAGTTRDALSERARLGPWPVRFLDTAGERDLTEAAARGDARALVEQQGQQIALDLAGRADVILRLIPAHGRPTGPEADAAPAPGEVRLLTQAAGAFGGTSAEWPEGAISALEDPIHARRCVEQSFGRALGLELDDGGSSDPLWAPGAAVPFDESSISLLESTALLSEVTDTVLDELLVEL